MAVKPRMPDLSNTIRITLFVFFQILLTSSQARPVPGFYIHPPGPAPSPSPFPYLHPPSPAPSPSNNVKVPGKETRTITRSFHAHLDPLLNLAGTFPKKITVRQDGMGDFTTIQAAVNSIPRRNMRRTVIKIGPGVYREKVSVERSKPFVTFQGEPDAMPTVTFDDTAAKQGTTKSASVSVDSDYFVAHNIIFENSAPRPENVPGAQAVAVKITGDKAAFYNCKFYGFQDTLFDHAGRHFFKDCYIRGTVDFIFGNGKSIYLNCTIESVADAGTTLTAQARTRTDEQSGFVFIRCRIIGTGIAYLGRAWRESSRVVFAYTYMDRLVNPQGWHDFGFPKRQKTVFYGEYKCMGPGAARYKRVPYAKALTEEKVKPFLDVDFIDGKTWLFPTPILVE